MICQECGQRPATLHFTKIVNGEKTEFHLCEICASEKGEMFPGPGTTSNFSIHQLLSGLLNFSPNTSSYGGVSTEKPVRCESCGLTYSQFSKSGRFGCADCYKHFGERLDPLFRRIHGNMEHRGKVPGRAGGAIKLRKELQQLKLSLQQKVMNEEFEQAAAIRDKIKQLEQQIESSL
jgi:protein arginine kinase activator